MIAAIRHAAAKPLGDLRDLAAAWTKFWFAPQDVATVALLRILAGGMILYTHLVWSLRLDQFFSASGWQPADVVHLLRDDATFWSFWWYVPDPMIWPAHYFCLVVLALFFIGLWTPVTSKLTYLIVVSYAHRVPLANFGLDQINGFLALYLALAPCGRVASVDWILRRRREAKQTLLRGKSPVFSTIEKSSWARLSTRLIQVQLCVLYTYAGLAKLKGEAWWDGNAIWMAAANLEYQSNSLLWLAWMRPIAEALTHATVIWECTFWATVWHPRIRPYTLFIGAMMHLGIGGFMGMWTFGLVMTFAYQSFTPSDAVRRLGQRLWALISRPATITYVPAEGPRIAWRSAFDFNNDLSYTLEESPASDRAGHSHEVALPTTWAEAMQLCPVPADDTGTGDDTVPNGDTVPNDNNWRLLYIDDCAASQAHALPYFSKHGFDIRVAKDWTTGRLLRAYEPCDAIVLNASPYDDSTLARIEAELADDALVAVVVLALPHQAPLWLRAGDAVLAGQTRLREVRKTLTAMLQPKADAERLNNDRATERRTTIRHKPQSSPQAPQLKTEN